MKIISNKFSVSILLSLISLLMLSSTLISQESKFRQQAWRYGVNLGVQTNSASLGWQVLYGGIPSFQSPDSDINYVDGTGLGLYGGIFGEYLSESWWGLQLRLSYDARDAIVKDLTKTPNSEFDTKMRYLTLEPLFRVDQNFIPNLNFYAGPFLAMNLNASFLYKKDVDQAEPDAEFDIININSVTYGVQGGLAYDFRITDFDDNTSLYISPFAEASWLINQKKGINEPTQNAITDVWSTGSYRLGIRVSFESRDPLDVVEQQKITDSKPLPLVPKVIMEMPEDNAILTKNVRGYFPIHPYVFFAKGSQEIPARYIMLTQADARNFKEADLENFVKGDLTAKETNVDQLMVSYYNLMNIYGDRMRNNPSENLVLRASDPENIDASLAANKIKDYLVNIFGINPDRIKIEVAPPLKPSGSIYTEEVSSGLIADENRRVEFVFNNPKMTQPLNYTIRDESSIDNDMIFSINSNTPYKSWDITITGEGKTLYFGPYAYRYARINPAELMRFLESGKYNANVVITDKNGKKTEENYAFKLSKLREMKNASRFLMLFNYNDADAVKSYEKIIVNEIVPGIETGNKVIIHGHTDNIGTEDGNQLLSQKRADEAKTIIVRELNKENKTNNIRTAGVGQSITQYSFNNRYPEGRMYNRNIFVEVTK